MEQYSNLTNYRFLLTKQQTGCDLYLFFTICAVNSASDTSLSPIKVYPFILAIPRLISDTIFNLKISVSPGTTLFLNFTLSILRKYVEYLSGSSTWDSTSKPPT